MLRFRGRGGFSLVDSPWTCGRFCGKLTWAERRLPSTLGAEEFRQMRPLFVTAVAVSVALAACGSDTGTSAVKTATTQQSAPTAAAKLATLDANADVANDDQRARKIQRKFRSLTQKGCNGPDIHLADLTVTAQKLLERYGIKESLASILSHVDRSVPPGGGKLVGGKCEQLFAAYVTLRHNG
jgi:hypothetical protein